MIFIFIFLLFLNVSAMEAGTLCGKRYILTHLNLRSHKLDADKHTRPSLSFMALSKIKHILTILKSPFASSYKVIILPLNFEWAIFWLILSPMYLANEINNKQWNVRKVFSTTLRKLKRK